MVTGSIRDEYSPFLFSVHYKTPLRENHHPLGENNHPTLQTKF